MVTIVDEAVPSAQVEYEPGAAGSNSSGPLSDGGAGAGDSSATARPASERAVVASVTPVAHQPTFRPSCRNFKSDLTWRLECAYTVPACQLFFGIS
jgi:hypothetical protein